MERTPLVQVRSYPLQNWVNFFWTRADRLGFFEALSRHGDFVGTRIGPYPVYVLTDPDLIKEVLVTHARHVVKGRGLERSKRLFGEGLLTNEGDAHLRQRRMSQPAFHRQRIFNYGNAMVELTERYTATLRDGQRRDLHRDLMQLTLAIVGKTLFDTDVEGDTADVGAALDDFLASFPFLLMPGIRYLEKLPLPQVRRIHSTISTLDRIIYGLIAQRRQSGRDHGDLLSMLIAAQDDQGDGGAMTDKQLRDECLTILLAGHETTANALTWTLYLLSQHPGVEAKLHAELDQVLGRVLGERAPSPDDLPRLLYTEQVFAESLRMYPPAWMMARRVIEPFALAGHTLPVNSIVFISPWLMHHHARYFPEPLRFDPERFTAEAKAARPRYTYFPFSAGPRNCIGEGFAWTEGVLLLASLARRFKFRLVENHRVAAEPLLTLRPRRGMPMIVQAR